MAPRAHILVLGVIVLSKLQWRVLDPCRYTYTVEAEEITIMKNITELKNYFFLVVSFSQINHRDALQPDDHVTLGRA